MWVYSPINCVLFAYVLLFFPDFSFRRSTAPQRSNMLPWVRNSTFPRGFLMLEPKQRLHLTAHCDAVRSVVFAEATPAAKNLHNTRKPCRRKFSKRRGRTRNKQQRPNSRKGRHGRMPEKHYVKSTAQNRNSIRKTSDAQRERMDAIIKEIYAFKQTGAEEACRTRWSKSTGPEANAKFQPHKTYGTLIDVPAQRDRNRRHAHGNNVNAEPSVVYLTGRTILQRTNLNINPMLFTVGLWVKPEGGQPNPAAILAGGRSTIGSRFETEWTMGITTVGHADDQKTVLYFSTKSNENTYTVHSPYAYRPEEWTHLAISSGAGVNRLFVNGIQVAARHDPDRGLAKQRANWDTLLLGGNDRMTQGYRGMLDKLVVWAEARPQPDIGEDVYNFEAASLAPSVAVADDFANWESWSSAGEVAPIMRNEETPERDHRVDFPELATPSCGQTICDNPAIIRSYVDDWTLRKPKMLHYNIVNINEDDGGQPMFTMDDVTRQTELLKEAFGPHNITWKPSLIHINDSGLRWKTIGCEPAKIGNRECNIECNHARMGYDGGDCDSDYTVCEDDQRGDDHCDDTCNKAYHNWDDGDCCDPRYTNADQTCFDPASPLRAYLSVAEYKSLVGANNANQLSVLFANWSNPNSIGISTFPWDKEVFTRQGGTVVQLRPYSSRGEISGLVHELGHNLGLLHVHHGAHNVNCDDVCAELKASMTTGDLCEDTNPTPMNTNCNEPTLSEAVCSIQNFTATPYSNFMSYADGSCQDNFTPQQRARMHCYVDLVYGSWTEGQILPPIPLPPKVVATSFSQRTITIAWPSPLNARLVTGERQCDSRCRRDRSLRQYASWASSPGAAANDWPSNQATGAPDQVACALQGRNFWMPALTDPSSYDCGDRCTLDLDFELAVVPSMFRVWVSYGTEFGDAVRSVEVMHEDGNRTTIGTLHAACDTPLSFHVNTDKLTRKIRINVTYPFTAVDAVEMISEENDANCSGCRPIKYKIWRDPPFRDELVVATEKLKFTDNSCVEGVEYSYAVQATVHPHHGEISPPVRFRLGQAFCGDGMIQSFDVGASTEECDDGNMKDEDGCDSACKVEAGFHCRGEPSVCYWHRGDGKCEDFELASDSLECPEDAGERVQQFAAEATSSSAALEALSASGDHTCASTREVLGPPDSACDGVGGTWSPCQIEGLTNEADEHWLKVTFEAPVVPASISIFVGNTVKQSHEEVFTILLPNGEIVSSGLLTPSCKEPVVITISKNLVPSEVNAFVVRHRSLSTAIDAVALTSSSKGSVLGAAASNSDCVLSGNFTNSNISCQISDSLSVPASPGSIWPAQTTCVVTCSQGYTPELAQRTTCRNGVWDDPALCTPISCGVPSHVPFASFACANGYKLNAACNFTCWRHARMVGEENQSSCGQDGTWSNPKSYCEPVCGSPPSIGFAQATCDALTKQASLPGDTCKYRCKPGYHVTQQSPTRKGFRVVCGPDGEWKGPGCQPVLCPPPPNAYKKLYVCTKGFLSGSECTSQCPHGGAKVNRTIRCEENGMWNSTFSLCRDIPTTSCAPPAAQTEIEITCDHPNAGRTCKARCVSKPGQTLREIFAISEKPNSQPKPDPKTRVLVCTGDSWIPNPEELFCVEPCDPLVKGDGRCDAKNNRAHCDWDGGDCCITRRRRGSSFPRPCEDLESNERLDLKNAKSAAARMRGRDLLAPLRAPGSKNSGSRGGGARHKKRRRGRGRHEVLRTSRPLRDDSRRKHKHRRKHRRKNKRFRG